MKEMCEDFKIQHHNSTPYRPKMNGAVEATNKNIKEEMNFFLKEYTKDYFKNKFNQLRGKWKDFTNLIKMETRLGYNSTT